LICLGLVHKGVCPPVDNPKETLNTLINYALPPGLKGIMAAALLAAMMGSVSAALNSIATVFSYDVVKRWWPDTTEHGLVLCGRIVTAVAMVAAILWSPFIGRFGTIFQGLTDLICYMAPPITAVFLLGVFWRRTSAKAALITLFSGAALGLAVFIIQFCEIGHQWTFPWLDFHGGHVSVVWTPAGKWEIQSMISGFFMFLISMATLVVFSYIFPHQHTPESESLVWKNPLEALRGKSWRLLGDFRVVSLLLFVTMVFLYWKFAGDQYYYPVELKITTADGAPVRGAKVIAECEDLELAARFNFSDVTDQDGICGYGTKSLAGGAPEGTKYRVRIEPAGVTKVELTDAELAAKLGERPVGTGFQVVERAAVRDPEMLKALKADAKDGKEDAGKEDGEAGERLLLVSDGAVIRISGGKNLMLLPKTPIQAKYVSTGTSGLKFTVEARQNKVQWKLDR
jgi:hypothetical protein